MTSTAARRFVERFALIAFALYHVPLFLNNYPSLGGGGFSGDGLAISWGHVFTQPGIWVARNVFHITSAMNGADAGDNADIAEEYARLLIAVVFGIFGALVWTLRDKPQEQIHPQEPRVSESLRVLLRYSIALGITSYGVAKILPMQFPPISAFTLEQRVGELSPMSLLWTFMEYSRPYAFLAGAIEMIAVFLLCVRQTATLGAIVCLVVMANVAFMNYAYSVPIKLYATMIVLSSLVLIAYDASRLFRVFVQNRAVDAAPRESIFHGRIPTSWRWAIKVALIGSVTLSSFVAMRSAIAERAHASVLDGAWVVKSFARSGAATDDSLSWRKLVVQQNAVIVNRASDLRMFCRRSQSADLSALAVECGRAHKGVLQWTLAADVLTFDGAAVHVLAHRVNPSDYPLMRAQFRWMQP